MVILKTRTAATLMVEARITVRAPARGRLFMTAPPTTAATAQPSRPSRTICDSGNRSDIAHMIRRGRQYRTPMIRIAMRIMASRFPGLFYSRPGPRRDPAGRPAVSRYSRLAAAVDEVLIVAAGSCRRRLIDLGIRAVSAAGE